uniref:hypothetical protein n=1 Tax=Candidatus Electronema sp. TaxID=2698783 RepID=UPI004056DEFE
MAAAYIIRKNDTYYFRQCLSQSARNRFNKYEFSKSLRVNRKKDAIVLSREIKIAFDQIFNKAMRKPSVTWQQIRDAVNEAFEVIFQRFVKSANLYGKKYDDNYNSLNFIPTDYDQLLITEDCDADWKSIADISSLAEKIAKWKELEIKKDSDEFNILCYTVAESLRNHDYNKNIFRKNPDMYSKFQVTQKSEVKTYYVKEVYERYWEDNFNGWSDSSIRNYKGVYNSLFEIMAFTAGMPFEEIEFSHLDNDFIDKFFLNLQLLPTQFSKRFAEKLPMKETLKYVKKIKEGNEIAELDDITKKKLIDTVSAKTLNEKYILKMNNFLDYAVRTGKMEKNWLSEREIKTKDETVSYRVYSDEELKIIFSDKMFVEKICYKDEYSRYWLPILALYSGARINEIAQLRTCDFQK